jgi:GWxTD domain-containing protein
MPVPGISFSRPRFSADAAIQPGTAGAPEVRIDYRLARSELLFQRTPEGYRAGYEIRVIFYKDRKDKLAAGDSFTRELRVGRYAETVMQGVDIIDHVTFRVPPDKYTIQVDLTDLNAENTSSTSFEFRVPNAPVGPIWFTDLTLGTLRPDSLRRSPGGGEIDPNPSRRYGDNLSRLVVTGEVVDGRPTNAPDSVYKLRYEVVSDVRSAVARGDTLLPRRGSRTPFLIRPALQVLDPGSYQVFVELVSHVPPAAKGKKPVPIRREKSFTVDQTSATTALDPKTALEVLRYVATEEELDEMDRLRTSEERTAFWEEFWRRRDPSPDTADNEARDEFYKRVQYANQHFGAGTPGWRTDMGHVYIRFGQPDEVVRNPFRFEGPPEEIWYYYRERLTFFFVDQDGFGRYELDVDRSSKLE